jgi:hydroxyacylglutathione hydrolase
MDPRPRSFLAPNASAMTIDGTVTYVVGHNRIAIIDPGSDNPAHLDRLTRVAAEADQAAIVITHDHPDHSTGAAELAERTGARVVAGADIYAANGTVSAGRRSARVGDAPDAARIQTDHGDLEIIPTPGHTPDHIALHWPAASAIFCGDLMMGGIDTAVVAAPEGDLADYLASLELLRSLRPKVIYPAHGPAFTTPVEALDRYVRHREDRLAQVEAGVNAGARDVKSLTDHIYGDSIDPGLRPFAESAVEAYLAYLRAEGRI